MRRRLVAAQAARVRRGARYCCGDDDRRIDNDDNVDDNEKGWLASVFATPENIQNGAAFVGGAEQPVAQPIARPISRHSGAITAFVGRALRGPVNQPVHISSFAEFQQEFGGLWQPSTLSYAVEQFFEQGGRRAVVVRIVNGGAPPTVALACGTDTLTLQALAPGTREFLRVAIDYDNLGATDEEHARDSFNLVVQRVRAPGSERIEVQETFRRVSVEPGTQRYVANVLLESKLVRVRGAVPKTRPDPTFQSGSRHSVGYALSNNDGDDGLPLTDYDIIGSAVERSGLFALSAVEDIAFVHIPPLGRGADIGASTLLVAERFCRERRALLIVDPPAGWTTPDQALAGLNDFGFRSEHAVMFFPRLVAIDRLRGRSETFPNGGAVAGMLARVEEQRPVWTVDAPEPEHVLRSGARLSVNLNEIDRWRLANHGVNTLRATRSASSVRLVPRTLAGGANSAADWGYLGPQRLASFIVGSIERGTRWVVWSRCERAVWPRVTRQVSEFLADLATLGAFPAAPADRAYMVVCDERVNSAEDIAAARLNLLVAFAGSRTGHYHGFLIVHAASGSSAKPVSVNRLELPIVAEPRVESVADIECRPRVRNDGVGSDCIVNDGVD